MKPWHGLLALLVLVLVVVPLLCVRIVDQDTTGLRVAGGQLLAVVEQPGVQIVMPPQQLRRVELRAQFTMLTGESLRTAGGEPLLVDIGAQWRVVDVRRFFAATGADDLRAAQRVRELLRAVLPQLLATRSYAQLAALPSAQLPATELSGMQSAAAALGIDVRAVELVRLEPVDPLATQMRAALADELSARAQALQRQLASAAATQRAALEQRRDDIIADGAREAGSVRGEGDARAAAIYAKAFGQQPEFAAFYRSLQAYRKVLGRDGDLLVITPDGAFFRYLRSPDTGVAPAAAGAH